MANKLVVLGTPWDVETEGLRDYMSKFGELDDCIVMKENREHMDKHEEKVVVHKQSRFRGHSRSLLVPKMGRKSTTSHIKCSNNDYVELYTLFTFICVKVWLDEDPEYYEFLKQNDEKLLEFDDADLDECGVEDRTISDDESDYSADKKNNKRGRVSANKKQPDNVITSAIVDSLCNSVQQRHKLGSVRSLLKAFKSACHCGDNDNGDDAHTHIRVTSSSVFNKIMLFVLREMDGILRALMKLPTSGGSKEDVEDVMSTKAWKKLSYLVKSYLGNTLHVLNQMTEPGMISFTLRRIRCSSVFLAAYPSLLRKYVKITIHLWGSCEGSLSVEAFLFLRDVCTRIGSQWIPLCLKGMYKAYALTSRSSISNNLAHIRLLMNCFIELLRVHLPSAYHHAFFFIQQLGLILRNAITSKTKDAFRNVYEWKYMNCLELWTGVVCTYSSEPEMKPLAYPLSQVISGVARLLPSAYYLPLRLRCARMLNRISVSTSSYIPVSFLLLDLLDMKHLNKPPSTAIGKPIDFRISLKVSKQDLKMKAVQEAYVVAVVEELAEHFAQWSYSAAFLELAFIPTVRMRCFSKASKVVKFGREMKELVRQVEANIKFINENRSSVSFLPNDNVAVESFLKEEKKEGISPLSQYLKILQKRSKHRNDSLVESSVVVGESFSSFGGRGDKVEENGDMAFRSSWLPDGEQRVKLHRDPKEEKGDKIEKKTKKIKDGEELDEDFVEDLVLSSDDEEEDDDNMSSQSEDDIKATVGKKRKPKSKSKLHSGKKMKRKKNMKNRRHN